MSEDTFDKEDDIQTINPPTLPTMLYAISLAVCTRTGFLTMPHM